jgi:hypothetical protein
MGRRSYSGEKRRKELARKAKREAKQERKQQTRGERAPGGGPPIDWESQVGSNTPPEEATDGEATDEEAADEEAADEEAADEEGSASQQP